MFAHASKGLQPVRMSGGSGRNESQRTVLKLGTRKGGKYVAIEKSPERHKPEELETARILTDKGYKVVLKNESGQVRTPLSIPPYPLASLNAGP